MQMRCNIAHHALPAYVGRYAAYAQRLLLSWTRYRIHVVHFETLQSAWMDGNASPNLTSPLEPPVQVRRIHQVYYAHVCVLLLHRQQRRTAVFFCTNLQLSCVWLLRWSTMSDTSKGIPQEQLPSQELHPPPMPVINLGHLSLDDPTVRSRVVNDIAKACRDLGYFQVNFL